MCIRDRYLTLRHPLKGRKVHDMEDSARDDTLSMGKQALFIEHPEDTSNRINTEYVRDSELPWADTDKMPMSICGPLISDMFIKSFVDGLHDPAKRPRADDWERALVYTADMLLPCANKSCTGKWFVFDNSRNPTCPFCDTAYGQDVPVLNLYSSRGESFRPDNYRITVYDGIGLYAWHTNRCLLYTSPSPRDQRGSRMPSSA